MTEENVEYLKNRDYHFIVCTKWNPVEDKLSKNSNREYRDYDEFDTDVSEFPDPVRTEYEIHQETLKKFAEENNFWDLHTLFPITSTYLLILKQQPGVEIIARPFTTAYKTRISIARLFDSVKILNEITQATERYVNSSDYLKNLVVNYTNPVKNTEK